MINITKRDLFSLDILNLFVLLFQPSGETNDQDNSDDGSDCHGGKENSALRNHLNFEKWDTFWGEFLQKITLEVEQTLEVFNEEGEIF